MRNGRIALDKRAWRGRGTALPSDVSTLLYRPIVVASCPLLIEKVLTWPSAAGRSTALSQPKGISPGAIGAPTLVPSSHGIIPKYVRFHLQLFEPVLENIADADDPHELIAVLDRHMANAPPRHQLHHIGNAVLR